MSLTPPQRTGRDQARGLRALLERHANRAFSPRGQTACRTIAVTSGKGGVGKSHLALNLAVALAQRGRRVCLLDGNLGLGSLDLLCGLNGYWNLAHVVTGARRLEDVILDGPAGIHLIPGASGLTDLADCPPHVQSQLLSQLESLEHEHDVLLIDTGSGIHQLVRQFAQATDDVLVVTTPEPTSIADAYATIKALWKPGFSESRASKSETRSKTSEVFRDFGSLGEEDFDREAQHSEMPGFDSGPELHVVVNQADTPEQARQVLERIQHTARMFLRADLGLAATVPRDPVVPAAVLQRQPFVLAAPSSGAARAVRQLADQFLETAMATPAATGFFGRLWSTWERQAA
jgi:flagellar biosynthesis protein FlhG